MSNAIDLCTLPIASTVVCALLVVLNGDSSPTVTLLSPIYIYIFFFFRHFLLNWFARIALAWVRNGGTSTSPCWPNLVGA